MTFLRPLYTLLCYVLIVLVFICVCIQAALDCEGKQEFSCVPGKPSKVNIAGLELDCPEKLICNQDRKTSCEPCIKKSLNCNGKFTCGKDLDYVTVTGVSIKCPVGYNCNKAFEDPCNPCIPKKCEGVRNFDCPGPHADDVIANDIVGRCRENYVCNKDYKYPCNACIEKESRADRFVKEIMMKYF